MKKLIMLLICFIAILIAVPALGADEGYVDYNICKLQWEPPADITTNNAPAGYKIKYGTTTGVYTNTYNYASTTPLTVMLNLLTLTLSPETKYYVVVCAYNAAGDGANSNEVFFTPTTDPLKFIGKPINLKVNIN
jgi:putative cell wall-binding protein